MTRNALLATHGDCTRVGRRESPLREISWLPDYRFGWKAAINRFCRFSLVSLYSQESAKSAIVFLESPVGGKRSVVRAFRRSVHEQPMLLPQLKQR